jgi:hypothetical protein
MCDYSLHAVRSRPAKVGDKLVSSSFTTTVTRGFTAIGDPNTAVCLLPGTEVAFEREVERDGFHGYREALGHKTARFRQIEMHNPQVHHDALEFPDGRIVLVTELCEGQRATVLQMPASPHAAKAWEDHQREREIAASRPRVRSFLDL